MIYMKSSSPTYQLWLIQRLNWLRSVLPIDMVVCCGEMRYESLDIHKESYFLLILYILIITDFSKSSNIPAIC